MNQINGESFELLVARQLPRRILTHRVRSTEQRRHHQRFVLQILDDVLLMFTERTREVDAMRGIPTADFAQSLRTQLDDVQLEIGAKALMIEFDDVGQAPHFNLSIETKKKDRF